MVGGAWRRGPADRPRHGLMVNEKSRRFTGR
jgi:hypothetical protein